MTSNADSQTRSPRSPSHQLGPVFAISRSGSGSAASSFRRSSRLDADKSTASSSEDDTISTTSLSSDDGASASEAQGTVMPAVTQTGAPTLAPANGDEENVSQVSTSTETHHNKSLPMYLGIMAGVVVGIIALIFVWRRHQKRRKRYLQMWSTDGLSADCPGFVDQPSIALSPMNTSKRRQLLGLRSEGSVGSTESTHELSSGKQSDPSYLKPSNASLTSASSFRPSQRGQSASQSSMSYRMSRDPNDTGSDLGISTSNSMNGERERSSRERRAKRAPNLRDIGETDYDFISEADQGERTPPMSQEGKNMTRKSKSARFSSNCRRSSNTSLSSSRTPSQSSRSSSESSTPGEFTTMTRMPTPISELYDNTPGTPPLSQLAGNPGTPGRPQAPPPSPPDGNAVMTPVGTGRRVTIGRATTGRGSLVRCARVPSVTDRESDEYAL